MSENLEWIKASSIKFKTKKEATERMKLMKECIDKYRNISILKIEGDVLNKGYYVKCEVLSSLIKEL